MRKYLANHAKTQGISLLSFGFDMKVGFKLIWIIYNHNFHAFTQFVVRNFETARTILNNYDIEFEFKVDVSSLTPESCDFLSNRLQAIDCVKITIENNITSSIITQLKQWICWYIVVSFLRLTPSIEVTNQLRKKFLINGKIRHMKNLIKR